jgi:hypothetical protein
MFSVIKVALQPVDALACAHDRHWCKARLLNHLKFRYDCSAANFDLIRSPLLLTVRAWNHIEHDVAVDEMLIALDVLDVVVEIELDSSRPCGIGAAIDHHAHHSAASRNGS